MNIRTLLFVFFIICPFSILIAQSWKKSDSLRLIYMGKAMHDSALYYADDVLKTIEAEKRTNDTAYAWALNNKGYDLLNKGDYQNAEYFFNESVRLFKTLGKEHTDGCTIAMNNLATLYNWTSRYGESEKLYTRVLEIRKELFGEKSPYYATSLNNLAKIYKDRGKNKEAEELYLKAIEIRKEIFGENDPEYAVTVNNLATLYITMGLYDKAEEGLLKCLEIFKGIPGEGQVKYLTIAGNLGGLYWMQGDYKKAGPMLEEVERKLKEMLGENHPNYITALANLAVLYSNTNEIEKAIDIEKRVLILKENVYGKNSVDYAISLNNMGVSYMALYIKCETDECRKENIEKAKQVYSEALEIRKIILGNRHPDYHLTLTNMANTLWHEGKYAEAKKLYVECMDIINFNIQQNFEFLSEKEKEKYFRKKYGSIEAFYSFASVCKDKMPDITENVYDNILKNKGLLLRSSTAMRLAISSGKDSSLIKKYDEWILLKKEITQLYSTPVDKRKKDPVVLEEEANITEKELVSSSAVFSDFEKSRKITWKNVQNGLKENEAAIEFVHFRFYNKVSTDSVLYFALIIKKGSRYPEMLRLFEEKQLIGVLESYTGNNLNYINGIYGTQKDFKDKLYCLIWKPIESQLENIKTVYVSPSGLLHKISLSSLSEKQNVFLCDNYDIRTQSSTSKIAAPEDFTVDNNMTMSIFGGIEYNSQNNNTDSLYNEGWQFLSGTKTESEKIKALLSKKQFNVNFYTNQDATEEEFKEIASNSQMMHIATHGFFFPDPKSGKSEPTDEMAPGHIIFRGGNRGFGVSEFVSGENPLMRSGLVFAGANDVWNYDKKELKDDGVLTAQEVANIKMTHTGLVVMSACETGLGDIEASEGVYGLQRSFKMAGVKYIIMSLWQVPDKETEEFMVTFYKQLTELKNIRDAFNVTQKEMRKKYDPFFWAAFVLIE